MIRDLFVILACILAAYFVAIAATVQGEIVFGMPIILFCAAISFATHWLIAIPSLLTNSERYFDFTGMIATLLIVSISMFSFIKSGQEASVRSIIVAFFVSVWAVRLGTFLYKRIAKSGEDKRFKEIKKSYLKFLMTWTLSALWVFLTTVNAITVIVLNQQNQIDLFLVAGATLWIAGFIVEAVADRQKKNFNELPENKDKFISQGLWSISRHPNYFGEITLWTGIAIVSLPLLSGWQFVTLTSPVFVFLLLTRVSGLPFLEEKAEKKWGKDKDYIEYRSKTPALVPFFGKKSRMG